MFVTCAIIYNNDKIFVAKRGPGKSNSGKWEFPGGKLEPDEKPEDCIVRELKEELKIDIKPVKHLSTVHYVDNGTDITLSAFDCTIIKGEITLTEHTESGFFSIEEIKKMDCTNPDKMIIASLFK